MSESAFVGIDIAKAQLDVALRPGDEVFSVINDEASVNELAKRLCKLDVERVVLEASGGWEVPACRKGVYGHRRHFWPRSRRDRPLSAPGRRFG